MSLPPRPVVTVPNLPLPRYPVEVTLLDGPTFADRRGEPIASFRVRRRDSWREPGDGPLLNTAAPSVVYRMLPRGPEALHGTIYVDRAGLEVMAGIAVGDRFLVEGSYVEWEWEEV